MWERGAHACLPCFVYVYVCVYSRNWGKWCGNKGWFHTVHFWPGHNSPGYHMTFLSLAPTYRLMLARSIQEHSRHTHTQESYTLTELVLKFASTPAAHTLRFTHTVSTQWHKQACPEDTEQPCCCSHELYSLCVEVLFQCFFSPSLGTKWFLAPGFKPEAF